MGALVWSATTPRCSLAATEVTQLARERLSPATAPSGDTPQVLSATPTLRGSASRGPSRTRDRSPGRPVSQLPVRSAFLSLAKCAFLWRSECLVRCAMTWRSSTTTMEQELLVEPQLSVEPELSEVEQELVLLLEPE